MKSIGTKLVLSTLGIALLAAPVFAQQSDGQPPARTFYDDQVPAYAMQGAYPNPVTRSGSAEQLQSGAAFNIDRGY